MSAPDKKSIMRNLGEFFGHILKGAKTDTTKHRHVLRKDVEQQQRGNITLRRTTIEEIEIKNDDQ